MAPRFCLGLRIAQAELGGLRFSRFVCELARARARRQQRPQRAEIAAGRRLEAVVLSHLHQQCVELVISPRKLAARHRRRRRGRMDRDHWWPTFAFAWQIWGGRGETFRVPSPGRLVRARSLILSLNTFFLLRQRLLHPGADLLVTCAREREPVPLP